MSIRHLHVLLPKKSDLAEISKDIGLAKELLDGEDLVSIPTETVYGLAAKGTSTKALKKIFKAKGRPINNPLILHFKNLGAIAPFVDGINNQIRLLAENFWPGPLTLLLPKTDKVPEIVTAGLNRVAVRIPNHELTLELLDSLDYPIAAPSANPSGYISPTEPDHVQRQLGSKIKLILDGGRCKSGIESTILGWENDAPIVYRKGIITPKEIEKVLGQMPKLNIPSKVLEAPGMLSSHYSPRTKTILTKDIPSSIRDHSNMRLGVISFEKSLDSKMIEKEIVLSPKGSLREMAKNLYAAMRDLDDLHLDVIIIERAPEDGIGDAINDRLERSSVQK